MPTPHCPNQCPEPDLLDAMTQAASKPSEPLVVGDPARSRRRQQRHRLSRAGNRRINRTLHIMAIAQLRNPTEGRAYYNAKRAAGKTPMEAMRCLKRRLSNIVYRQMLHDHDNQATGLGGHSGTTLKSSVTDLTPDIGSSDKSWYRCATPYRREKCLRCRP
jgi:hypothetical protein